MSSINKNSLNISLDRLSDVILLEYNRFYDAKLNGVLNPDELSALLTNTGDLFANKIMQGKSTSDEIESVEALISGFRGEHKNHYYSYPHEGLDRATSTFEQSIDVAIENTRIKGLLASPVKSAEEYENSFKPFKL